jgi:3-hydroxyacyl-[acyl-carrier-protein] dehydratase
VTALMVKFAVNHPCGAGHFPGNPIIPGALLLDEVLACIGEDMARKIRQVSTASATGRHRTHRLYANS